MQNEEEEDEKQSDKEEEKEERKEEKEDVKRLNEQKFLRKMERNRTSCKCEVIGWYLRHHLITVLAEFPYTQDFISVIFTQELKVEIFVHEYQYNSFYKVQKVGT